MSEDGVDPRFVTFYTGTVTDRTDPLMIGRVKVKVPGLLEPSSGWAFPLAVPGGGDAGVGFYAVPKVGAEVGVWFYHADSDVIFYAPAHWGAPGGNSQAPSALAAAGATASDAPDIAVFEVDRFKLVFDGRLAKESFEITDKVSGDGIAYDSTLRAFRIKAMAAITIEAIGAVEIKGAAVTIAGRPVIPGSGPI